MIHKILIIGTQPQCPRCRLLSQVIVKKVEKFNINAKVSHLAYTEIEAVEFAKNLGMEPGTAKQVAKKAGLEIDIVKIDQIIQNKELSKNTEFKEINDCNWSPDLDEFLKSFQNIASEVGILMTPILIINGELKHTGSVPELNKILEWLSNLRNV